MKKHPTISKKEIPKVKKAFIGGSSTLSINFPEDIGLPGLKVLDKKVFLTPFGESPEFKLVEVYGEPVLMVRMHGWRAGVSRADASHQIFWVLEQAGVKSILAEGGVGAVRKDFRLRQEEDAIEIMDIYFFMSFPLVGSKRLSAKSVRLDSETRIENLSEISLQISFCRSIAKRGMNEHDEPC
jgi:purine nucleoside phosphorylase